MTTARDRVRVAVVFHSAHGRTRALAEAVTRGAAEIAGVVATAFDVTEGGPLGSAGRTAVARLRGDELARADAIVFGCPTYMGSASAELKAFMDDTAAVWALQGWRDKLAAGFTHSAAPSGDKLGTLTQLAVFAAQHGMIWVGLGLPPTYASATASDGSGGADKNRLGSHLGAMAQSTPGRGAELDAGDVATAVHLGRRVAELASALRAGRAASGAAATGPSAGRHQTTHAWSFPAHDRPQIPGVSRTNLRELAARPARLEHHLTVVAKIGDAQLEIATASEPLYFAHINISDEYAVALPTGDELVDQFPLRTFLAHAVSGADVGRYNHRVGDLVLHPVGTLHWPGKLRPPYDPFPIPKGMRRTGVSLVYCASSPTPSVPGVAPLVSTSREADAKTYTRDAPPMSLVALLTEGPREVARVADTRLELVVRPREVALANGGYLIVLEADASSEYMYHACDLVRIPPGFSLKTGGVARALVFASDTLPPSPPLPAWERVPPAPFAALEDAPRNGLPFDERGLCVEEMSSQVARVTIGSMSTVVPRHWLARMLYRVAAHGLALGYVETYGGFYVEDLGDPVRLGIRDATPVTVSRKDALAFVERLYRAVAPDGYEESLST